MLILDISKFLIDGWQKRYPNESTCRRNDLLNKLLAEGKLGNKNRH
jgi:hypothetical protein